MNKRHDLSETDQTWVQGNQVLAKDMTLKELQKDNTAEQLILDCHIKSTAALQTDDNMTGTVSV